METSKKWLLVLVLVLTTLLSLGLIGFLAFGCGQQTADNINNGVSTDGDYTISGKVGTISSQGLSTSSVLSVTNIVAIGANNNKYVATLNSDGTFTLAVKTGRPYAVGFYNKTGGTITLLGYLRQAQVNWDSLPLIAPATSATNLGTVEINTGSVEATPSIALNDLLSSVNMSNATANLYGDIDDMMTRFTNVDVDGNGQFDFLENKAYFLDVLVQIGKSNNISSGELDLMTNKFYDNYYAVPNSYQCPFYAVEGSGGADKPANGTAATLTFPLALTDMMGVSKTSIAATTGSAAGDYGWSVSSYEGDSTASTYTTPEVVPSGTYTFEVYGRGTYTLRNIKGASAVAVGTVENIIYPVLKITTNEAGNLATVYYKWMIRQNSVTREASATEVHAIIMDSDSSTDGFILTFPTLTPNTTDGIYRAPKKLERDAGSLDISAWNLKSSAINKLVVAYNLSTNIDCRYYFMK